MKLLSAITRDPTRGERAKERSIVLSTIADTVVLALQVLTAIITGSLTMLSEFVRTAFMLLIEFYSLWLLRGVHRGRLKHFQFGVGKIEQFSWLIIGMGLFASGFWIAQQVIGSVVEERAISSPLGLAIAAIVNGANLTVNGLSFYAMMVASSEGESDIFRANLKSRVVKLANSVILQITLTIAALSSDPVIAHFMDGLGAAFVACVMVISGFGMVARSLPDLLDAPLAKTLQEQIVGTVGDMTGSALNIMDIRSRRSGGVPQVELILSPGQDDTVSKFNNQMERIRQAISKIDDQIEVSIVIADSKSPSSQAMSD